MSTTTTATKFDQAMYRAALAYYGLPPDYRYTFKRIHGKDLETGELLYYPNGAPKTFLVGCNAARESSQGQAVWIQVNIPRADAAKNAKGNPKKAKNEDIARLANITLDFEYPQEPAKALDIGVALARYLEQQGLAEPGLPVENTGAGPHIVLPLPSIEIVEGTADRWNTAVRAVVTQYIKPEFERLVKALGIEMDLSGFDISRCLSAPGTWRPTNPKKPDCDELKKGFLRCWLPPYTDGHYPTRKESVKLAALVRAAYEQGASKATGSHHANTPQPRGSVAQWLAEYAAKYPNDDRSALFQTLVNATSRRYGEYMVWELKDDINMLSGSKYNGRLDEEIKRSLPLSFNLSDLGNAERLVARHGTDLRYCYGMRNYLVWTGTHWQEDKSAQAERFAKDTVRGIYAEAAAITDADEKKADAKRKEIAGHAMRSESKRAIKDMLALAQSEPGIPIKREQLDASAWLLNCANGTLDLRTGELYPHRRDDLLTRCLSTRYNPEAEADGWLNFLITIFHGDEKLIQYIQRVVGYALTGDTSEQCFFLGYGKGDNGKSTFLETLYTVFGDYAQSAEFKAFLARDNEGVRNDIARMAGRRLVIAKEADRGRRFAESLIKSLTGGDTVTARFLYQDFFDFKPAFKLFLAVNHKPAIKGTDLGIWRRVRLIPFNVTIEESQKDRNLPRKLAAEAEGILAWAVQGCLDWQREGLGMPKAVEEATGSYRKEMDTIAQFLAEECTFEGADLKVETSVLKTRCEAWCEANSERYDAKLLRTALLERRCTTKRSTGGRYIWEGIALKSEPSEGSEPKNG